MTTITCLSFDFEMVKVAYTEASVLMAWIRGGLSQFTDQISSFTKEVLTETTEEVEDPAAELLVARKKVVELQERIDRFQNEWENLQKHCAEASERADTAEYQVATISQEYRKLFQDKDKELRRLQMENQTLREQNKGLVSPDSSGLVHSPLKDLVGSEQLFGGEHGTAEPGSSSSGGGGSGGNALMWGEDLSEIINSQSEINHLRSELAKQAAEIRHWKQVARDNKTTDSTQPADDSLQLRQRVEELQQCVEQEVLGRERELRALQAAHTDAIHSLSQKHQLQVELLQQQVLELEEKLTAVESTDGGGDQQPTASNGVQVEKLVQEKARLSLELDDMQDCITQHQESISRLQTDHSKSKREVEQLTTQVELLAREVEAKEREVSSVREGELNTSLREAETTRLALEQETIALREVEKARAALEQENLALKNAEIARKQSGNAKEEEQSEEQSRVIVTLRRDLEAEQRKSVELVASNASLLQNVAELENNANRLAADKKFLESQLEQVRGSHTALKSEVEGQLQAKQAECGKYDKELARLRAHLLQVEDQYTKEALRSDEREADLRRQVADLQDKLRQASSVGASETQQMQGMVGVLESELRTAMAERDDALLQMRNAHEQAQQNATALLNLQSVLEQFQRDQSSELNQALKRSQTELADALQQCKQLRQEQAVTQTRLHEATMAAKAAASLTVQLGERDKRITQLADQVAKLESSLDVCKAEIDKLAVEGSSQVDRRLVKNLVLGYVHAPSAKKTEVLRLIARILEFSSEELESASGGGGRRSGWLSGLWRGPPPSPSSSADASFSQLFVKFLESESLTTSNRRNPPQQSSGYIDPNTDPDRPSRATVLPAPTVRPPSSLPATGISPSASPSSSVHSTPPTTEPRLSSTTIAPPTSPPQPMTATQQLASSRRDPPLTSLAIRGELAVGLSSGGGRDAAAAAGGGDQKLSSLFAFSPVAVPAIKPAKPRDDAVKLTNHSFQSSLLNSVLSD